MVMGLILIGLIIPSSLTLNNREIATKLQIENNLEEKIVNVISKIYATNKFAVTTNIALVAPTKSVSTSANGPFGALELEGILPSVPQKSEDGIISDNNDYKIEIKDITIWLDYELDIINAQQQIKQFLFASMDWLEDCENCIKFRSRQFPGPNTSMGNSYSSSSNLPSNLATEDDIRIIEDNISYIMEQIDKNNENNNGAKNDWMVDYLERTLQEQKDANSQLSDKLMEQTRNIIQRDSSIIMQTTSGQKEIAETAMKENSRIVEKVSDNQFENNKYLLIVLFVLIGIVVLLVVLSFFNKGPQTVYLKPKNQLEEINNNSSQTSNSAHTLENKTLSANQATQAYDDGSVIQSDLKSIKQSAVKMSVGQKQGASQIVQDWLDDGENQSEDDNNDKKED
jgi:hypothetical protein